VFLTIEKMFVEHRPTKNFSQHSRDNFKKAQKLLAAEKSDRSKQKLIGHFVFF